MHGHRDVTGRLGGLLRGTLIYGVGQALSRSMTLLLLPVLTAYLEPAAYGLLAVLTAFGLLLNVVFSIGLGAATAPSYFASGDAGQKSATIWTAFAILCASTVLMVAVAAIFPAAISAVVLQDGQHGTLILLAVGATAFSILSLPFRQYLMFEERPLVYVWLSLGSLAVSLALCVWMVAVLGRGLRGVLEADAIGQAVTCLFFAVPVIRSSTVRIRRKLATDLVALGLPLIPAFASMFVLQHGSRYILQWLDGPEAVGIYAVGVNVASSIGLFVAGFQSAWMPYFMSYANRPDEARVAFGRVATYYVIGIGTISLLLYIFAIPAVRVLASPEYRDATRVVGMAATAQFLSGLFLVQLPGMYFAREVRYIGAIQAVAAGIAVALNFVLVPWLGYFGSAIAVVLSYAVLNLVQFWWNHRRGYLRVTYDWSRLYRFSVLYVVVVALSLLPRELAFAIECLLSVACAAALIGCVWWLLRPEERAVVRTRLKDPYSRVAGEVVSSLVKGR
jgi:O-antigen/teichoic acid export membrane protein